MLLQIESDFLHRSKAVHSFLKHSEQIIKKLLLHFAEFLTGMRLQYCNAVCFAAGNVKL